MVTLQFFLFILITIFAVIGFFRGWAREIMAIFGGLLGLAMNHILRRYIPLAAALPDNDISLFWVRAIILLVMVYFAFETVNLPYFVARLGDSKSPRDRLQNTLFGAVLGAFTGYLVVGTLLYYIHIADYPFPGTISKPDTVFELESVNRLMAYMPPAIFGEPAIYFAIIIAFVFVLVIFI